VAAVQIVLNQAGKSAGVAGVARDDLDTGVPVQAQAVGGPFASYLWTFVSKAININLGARASSAFGSGTSATTSITPIDVAGEYLVQVAVDSGAGLGATTDDVARIVFYAGDPAGDASTGALNADPAELPQRMPAFREKLEGNVPDAVDAGGNTEGWSRPWLKLKAVVDRIYKGKSWAWARVTQTSGGASATPGFNAVITRTGVGTAHVSFVRNMPSASIAVVACARGTAGSVTVLNEASNGFDVERGDINGTLVDADWAFELKVAT
jgi:hypothetical protein